MKVIKRSLKFTLKNSNLNYINSFKNIDLDEANIHESAIRKYMPEILDLLLIDRTKSTIKKVLILYGLTKIIFI